MAARDRIRKLEAKAATHAERRALNTICPACGRSPWQLVLGDDQLCEECRRIREQHPNVMQGVPHSIVEPSPRPTPADDQYQPPA